MNKSVLALSTALSLFVITPAFAQNNTTTTAKPAVDCTVEANKNDPACMNKQGGTSQQQSQSTTTPSTTDQNAAGTGTTTDMSKQNAQSGSTTGTSTTTDQNAAGTSTTTDQNAASTTTPSASTSTMSASGDLFVPQAELNNAQMMSANDYIGKTVYDQNGKNIGDVNDLIMSQDGKIQAVILGVGGFLGIGEKDVAVSVNSVKMTQDGNSKRLVVETTKEQLTQAPTYDKNARRYAEQNNGATTTDTTGSTTAPATGTDTTTGNSGGATGGGSTSGTNQ